MSESRPLPSGELRALARQALIDRGLEPDFPPDALREVARIDGPARAPDGAVRDLRRLLWASIDNDDSRDLDQLTVAERLASDDVRILVAIADVDALVKKGSAIDRHAERNTTSVYTPGTIFPMLPEKLSTDLTSLADHEDRLAVVIELTVAADGSVAGSDVYGASVRNRAKLAYNSVAAWLTGGEPQGNAQDRWAKRQHDGMARDAAGGQRRQAPHQEISFVGNARQRRGPTWRARTQALDRDRAHGLALAVTVAIGREDLGVGIVGQAAHHRGLPAVTGQPFGNVAGEGRRADQLGPEVARYEQDTRVGRHGLSRSLL